MGGRYLGFSAGCNLPTFVVPAARIMPRETTGSLFDEPEESPRRGAPREHDSFDAPLAERMRPASLRGGVSSARGTWSAKGGSCGSWSTGAGRSPSLILWGRARHRQDDPGPPARRGGPGRRFAPLSAVLSGVKELREAIAEAREARRRGRRTILFIDEIHRFNKAQQDALLPAVEDGTVTLIGATTENPSFEVNARPAVAGPGADAPAPLRGGRRDHPPPGPGRPGRGAWPRSGRRSPRRTWPASPRPRRATPGWP